MYMSQSPSQFDVSSVNGAQQCDCGHQHSSFICVWSVTHTQLRTDKHIPVHFSLFTWKVNKWSRLWKNRMLIWFIFAPFHFVGLQLVARLSNHCFDQENCVNFGIKNSNVGWIFVLSTNRYHGLSSVPPKMVEVPYKRLTSTRALWLGIFWCFGDRTWRSNT